MRSVAATAKPAWQGYGKVRLPGAPNPTGRPGGAFLPRNAFERHARDT